MVSSLPSAIPHIKSGKTRALAVTSAQRSFAMPELPTVAEAAGFAGYDAVTWQGLVLPAAAARPIIARVSGAAIKVLALSDVKDRLLGLGYEPIGNTPAEFAHFISAELKRWPKVIQAAGIRME